MFLLYKQESYVYTDEMGERNICYYPAEQFTLWENQEDALAFVQILIEKSFKYCTNVPTNFRVEDGMIKFDNTLLGKVVEKCDFDYYIREFNMSVKPHIATDINIERTTSTPGTWTFGG